MARASKELRFGFLLVLFAPCLLGLSASADEGGLLPATKPLGQGSFEQRSDGALVIVSTVDGEIHALEAKTGEVRWKISTGGSVADATKPEHSQKPNRGGWRGDEESSNWDTRKDLLVRESPKGISLARDSVQVIPSYERGGGLWLFHKGRLRRVPMSASELVHASPFLGEDGYLYIGKKKTFIFAVDAVNGQARWQHLELDQRQCSSEDMHDTLILTRSEYTLHAKDARTGTQNWNMTIAEFEPQGSLDKEFFAGHDLPVLVAGNGEKGRKLFSFDRLTGDLNWSKELSSTPVCAHIWANQHSKELPIHNEVDFEQKEDSSEPQDLADRSVSSVYFGNHEGTLFARPSWRPNLETDNAFSKAKMQLAGSRNGGSGGIRAAESKDTALIATGLQHKADLLQSLEDGSLTSDELVNCVHSNDNYHACLLGYHRMNLANSEVDSASTDDNFVQVPFEPPLAPFEPALAALEPSPTKRNTWYYIFIGFSVWPLVGIGMCWTSGGRRKLYKIVQALRESQGHHEPPIDLSEDDLASKLLVNNSLSRPLSDESFTSATALPEPDDQLALVPASPPRKEQPAPPPLEAEDGEASKRSTVDSQQRSKLQKDSHGDSNLSLDTSNASFSWSYTDSDFDEETESRDAFPSEARMFQRNKKKAAKANSNGGYSPSFDIKDICAELDEIPNGSPRRRERSGGEDSADNSGPGWTLSRDSSWSTEDDSANRGRSISLGSHSRSVKQDVEAALTAAGLTFSAPSSPSLEPTSPFLRQARNSNDWQAESRYLKDFVELGQLGKGGFGSVYRVRQRLDEREYAVKKIRLENDPNSQMNQRVIREVKNMAILSNHPNIVRYYGTWTETVAGDQLEVDGEITFSEGFTAEGSTTFGEEPTNATAMTDSPATWLYIQMELCSTSLRECLNDGTWTANLDLVRGYITDVSEGLLHCHSQKYIHRDIKPDNIFIVHEVAKLGDFGLSCRTGPDDGIGMAPVDEDGENQEDDDKAELTKGVGTHMYSSPELDNNGMYDEKVDMYALGICLFEMLNKFSTRMERIMVIGKLKQAMARKYDEIPSPFSSEASKATTEGASNEDSEAAWSSERDLQVDLTRSFSQIVPEILLPDEMLNLKQNHPLEAELVMNLMALEPAQRPTARKFRDRLREIVPRDKEQELLESKRYIQQLKIQLKLLEDAKQATQKQPGPSQLEIPPPMANPPHKQPVRTLSDQVQMQSSLTSPSSPEEGSGLLLNHRKDLDALPKSSKTQNSPSKIKRHDTAPGEIVNMVSGSLQDDS